MVDPFLWNIQSVNQLPHGKQKHHHHEGILQHHDGGTVPDLDLDPGPDRHQDVLTGTTDVDVAVEMTVDVTMIDVAVEEAQVEAEAEAEAETEADATINAMTEGDEIVHHQQTKRNPALVPDPDLPNPNLPDPDLPNPNLDQDPLLVQDHVQNPLPEIDSQIINLQAKTKNPNHNKKMRNKICPQIDDLA